jgi:hypothetical protein
LPDLLICRRELLPKVSAAIAATTG